jgi:signal peptidase I
MTTNHDQLRFTPSQIRFHWLLCFLVLWAFMVLSMFIRGFETYGVRGHSMRPTLDPGDTVLVDPRQRVDVGDVIVFYTHERPTRTVVHRVISIAGDTIVTKGDNTSIEDHPIRMSDVRGVVIFDVPVSGWRMFVSVIVLMAALALAFNTALIKAFESGLIRLWRIKATPEEVAAEELTDERIEAVINSWTNEGGRGDGR